MSGRREMTSAIKYGKFLGKWGNFSFPKKSILFPSIYNTRISVNNTELIIIRIALICE